MAFGQPSVDFNYFLQRKYALLAQNADADTSRAASGAVQAATGALTGAADARLTNTRADLLPGESASQVGLQGAQTNLFNNQASVVIPTAQAQIRNTDANTALTGTQNKVLTRDGLTEFSASNPTGALGRTLGPGGYTGFRLPADTPVARPRPAPVATVGSTPTEQQPGETYAAWVARLRAAGY